MVAAGAPLPGAKHGQAMAGFVLDMIRGNEQTA
jgi:hypothetical protein